MPLTKDQLQDPTLTENAREVLKRRYLIKDENGDPTEEPKDLFFRVARTIAEVEYDYGATEKEVDDWTEKFYWAMSQGYFLPNSPTLFNAGKELGQLSACFVLPIKDSMVTEDGDGIMDTLRDAAIIHKSGGGTGFAFSRLRPNGSRVDSTGGVASGPVSFMKIYDEMTEQVKQGGYRRGANMGILRIDHPDVIDFINAKTEQGQIENFNISVAVTNDFMEAVQNEELYELDHPEWDKDLVVVNAARLFDHIVENAWLNGEPGLFFIDEANKHNPVPHLFDYEATNPCWIGNTKVWTSEGPQRFDTLAEEGNDVPVLTQTDEGRLKFQIMRNPRQTRVVDKVISIALDDGTTLECTPTHNIYLRSGEKVEAKDLSVGDSIASVYRHNANQKGYKRLTNGIEEPLEHHVAVEWSEGRRPSWPKEHTHHKNGNKDDNRPENLEILPAGEHNAMGMSGEENPMAGVWGERNPLFNRESSGENNGRWRADISTEEIKNLREEGHSYSSIAEKVGCSKYTVAKRLGYERPPNHKIVGLEVLDKTVPVYSGTVDNTHRYFVVCENGGILSANCGEQPLGPYDVCNLGSVNLGKFVGYDDYEGEYDPLENVMWNVLSNYIHLAVRFLDNVIDANNYPLEEIRDLSDRIRRIGFGPMGLADMLVRLGLPYNSQEALEFCEELGSFIEAELRDASKWLAMERGTFPEWEESVWGPNETCARNEDGERIRPEIPLRNSNINTVAPTGTISIIAGCSGGIEPHYAVAFMRNQAGTKMVDINDDFVSVAKDRGFYSEELMNRVAEEGTIDQPEVPEDVKQLFATSGDISPSQHIDMQAVWQKYTDSAISKTINFPAEATIEDVREGYFRAYEKNCKGVTVYRDGSREGQVLSTGKTEDAGTELASSNGCPECGGELIQIEGCEECKECSYSACSI